MLRQDINEALKTAVKAKDQRATSTLRLILAALKDRDIAARSGGGDDDGISDEALLEMLQKMIKQRYESIEQYKRGNRPDLAAQESEEIEVIARFLPKQLEEAETAEAVDAAIKETSAASIKDMGKIMAVLKKRYPGRMDFAKAAGMARVRLGA